MDIRSLFLVFLLKYVFEYNVSVKIRQANDSPYRLNSIMLL